MLRQAFDLAQPAIAAALPGEAAEALRAALVKRGASYFQARLYRRPAGRLTSVRHWEAGGFLTRHDPGGWVGGESSRYICFDCNPLLEPVARKVSRFDFADFAPRSDRRYGRYWEAMGEGRVGTGIGAMAFGPDDTIAAVHIGFAERDIDASERQAVGLAGAIAAQHMLDSGSAPAREPAEVLLSARECDVMAYVCEGKTDWEIGAILGVSETTARFHADNARRKLGASNRAHAVARYIARFGFQ
ncbi:MAG: hypothetical protein JNJ92_06255 [Altererythrobacter sp.]|nr:hypothetical protein [Altererythrobacter sp.]